MKPLLVFGLFITALVLAQFAQAQTADDVIEKYIAAMGGKEKLSSLKTLKMEGSMSIMGNDVAITFTKKHLVGMRVDISVAGSENYQIVTPTGGTVFMPVQGMSEPTAMSDDQLKPSLPQLDVQGALFNYKEKGTAVELAGKETVDGEECYNLKITFKSGVTSNYFVSSKTSFLVKITGKRNINGEEVEVSTTFSNFKQNADGYWFPYTSVTTQGQTDYSKIDTNIPVEDGIFK